MWYELPEILVRDAILQHDTAGTHFREFDSLPRLFADLFDHEFAGSNELYMVFSWWLDHRRFNQSVNFLQFRRIYQWKYLRGRALCLWNECFQHNLCIADSNSFATWIDHRQSKPLCGLLSDLFRGFRFRSHELCMDIPERMEHQRFNIQYLHCLCRRS